MSKVHFEIAFEGSPFDNGEIDVRDLAPTLLAFGNVIQAASRALNGERAEARLKVSAAKEGSFIAQLIMDVGWMKDMLDAIVAHHDRVVAANELLDLLLKSGKVVGETVGSTVGLLHIIKMLRGGRPKALRPRGDGTTEITINGTVIIADDRTVSLLRDLPTREAIADLGEKASRVAGLDTLRIGQSVDEKRSVTLTRSDIPSLNIPPDREEPEIEVTQREAWLKMVSVQLRDGYKWRFSDGGERPFTAEMEDTDFQNRVQEGKVTLNANDAIKCRLREEQSISGSHISKTIYVEQVLEHRPGARQLNLI